MNFKNETLRTMQELGKQHPEFLLKDILFSCLQPIAVKNGQSLAWLRDIEVTDEDFYTAAENAIKKEENE